MHFLIYIHVHVILDTSFRSKTIILLVHSEILWFAYILCSLESVLPAGVLDDDSDEMDVDESTPDSTQR